MICICKSVEIHFTLCTTCVYCVQTQLIFELTSSNECLWLCCYMSYISRSSVGLYKLRFSAPICFKSNLSKTGLVSQVSNFDSVAYEHFLFFKENLTVLLKYFICKNLNVRFYQIDCCCYVWSGLRHLPLGTCFWNTKLCTKYVFC